MKTRHIPLLLLLTGLLMLNLACSDDDDDNPGGVVIPPIEDPALQAMTTEGVVIVEGLIDMVPGWMSGQLGKRDTTTPVWDANCMCWRWTITDGEYTDPLDTWSRNWNLALTYYQGETPQESYEGADRIGVVIGYNYNTSSYSEMSNSNSWFTFNLESFAVPNGPETIMITASGTGSMGAESYSGEDYDYYSDEFTISLILTMPALGGCPTGGLDIDIDTRSFSVGFSGGTTAYWDYVYGPGQFKEGEITLTCGK